MSMIANLQRNLVAWVAMFVDKFSHNKAEKELMVTINNNNQVVIIFILKLIESLLRLRNLKLSLINCKQSSELSTFCNGISFA